MRSVITINRNESRSAGIRLTTGRLVQYIERDDQRDDGTAEATMSLGTSGQEMETRSTGLKAQRASPDLIVRRLPNFTQQVRIFGFALPQRNRAAAAFEELHRVTESDVNHSSTLFSFSIAQNHRQSWKRFQEEWTQVKRRMQTLLF